MSFKKVWVLLVRLLLKAEETISGSLNAFESALQNLLVGFGNADADMEQLSKNMVDAFQSVVKNITPVIENIVKALPIAIEALLDAFLIYYRHCLLR